MDFRALTKIDNFIDKSLGIEELMRSSGREIFRGKKGFGKSSFLSMLKCYLDKNEDSKDVFSKLKIASEYENWEKHLNKYCVIFLDFSDFYAESFKSAIEYFNKKMTKLYIEMFDAFLFDYEIDSSRCEYYLDVVESKFKKTSVENSLNNLICIYHSSNNKEKLPLAILIDNIVQTEVFARKFGYSDKMGKFIRKFLGEEYPIKFVDVYLQVGDYILNNNYWERENYERRAESYYCQDIFPSDVEKDYAKEYFLTEEENSLLIKKEATLDSKKIEEIAKRRLWIFEEKEKYKQKRILDEKRTRERYAKKISKDVKIPFDLLGVRKYEIKNQNEKYQELNEHLKTLFDFYLENNQKSGCIYEKRQNIDFKQKTDWKKEDLIELVNFAKSKTENWEDAYKNDDYYWSCFWITDKKKTPYDSSEHIKIYATVSGNEVKNIFMNAIKFLIENGENSFAAKVSKLVRDDLMCFWVYKNEYLLLEQFFIESKINLITPMKFMAYKNGLGISHELSMSSHNSLQSELIEKYFKYLIQKNRKDRDSVSLSEMYSLFIAGWNRKVSKKHLFSRYAEYEYADSLVVLLETIEILIGNKEIDDDNILLSNSEKVWSSLAHSYCWSDVEERYKSESKF